MCYMFFYNEMNLGLFWTTTGLSEMLATMLLFLWYDINSDEWTPKERGRSSQEKVLSSWLALGCCRGFDSLILTAPFRNKYHRVYEPV